MWPCFPSSHSESPHCSRGGTPSAGIGDTVLLVQEGKAVQQILGHKNAPVHSIVVAVVDSIDVESNFTSNK